MKNRQITILGLIVFFIGLGTILIDKNTENGILKFLSEYGRYLTMLGGGLIGYGYVKKNQKVN